MSDLRQDLIRSVAEDSGAARAVRMGKTFAMWPLNEYGYEAHRQALCASDLEDAVKIATPPMMKASIAKGGFPPFVILETDDTARPGTARHKLHFYIVKCRREHRSTGPFGMVELNAVPYAVHTGSLAMDEFAPRRPFDAKFDCPGTGRQPGEGQMVEVRR